MRETSAGSIRAVIKSFRFRNYDFPSYKNSFHSSKYFASQFEHFVPSNVFCKSNGFETGGDRCSVSDLTCVDSILYLQHMMPFHKFTLHGFVLVFRFQFRAFTRITFRTTYRESYIYIYFFFSRTFGVFSTMVYSFSGLYGMGF
jgi:hypothetical protein